MKFFDRLLLELGDVQVWAARAALRPFRALGSLTPIRSLAALRALTARRPRLAITGLEATFRLETVVLVIAIG